MALFVIVVMGIIVTQVWFDWRDTQKLSSIPSWAKGVGLAAIVAVSFTASASFASVMIQDTASQWNGTLSSGAFWLELAFLASLLGIIVAGARKKKLRVVLFAAGLIVAAAFWVGIQLSS